MGDKITPEYLSIGLSWYAIFVFSTTLHEAAHAWSAWKLGDPTAWSGGQVSLNPLPHMEREPMGMLVVPVLSYFLFGYVIGWASAPYDPSWAGRFPRKAAIMALAGPAANLFLAVVAFALIAVGLMSGYFHRPDIEGIEFSQFTAGDEGVPHALSILVSQLFTLNLILFAFNLLPLPPLDGSAAINLVLPLRWALKYQMLMAEPGYRLLGMFVAWNAFPFVFGPLYVIAYLLLYLLFG